MTPEEKITKARSQLVLEQPFFGVIALRLPMVRREKIPTMQTNGKTIEYSPDFVDRMTVSELKTVIAHEILHVTQLHHLRRNGRDPGNWNIAADFAINVILTDSKFEIPAGGLLDRALRGMSAEDIYDRAPDPEEGDPGEGAEGEEGGSGEGEGEDPAEDEEENKDPDPGGMGGVVDAEDENDQILSPAEIESAEREVKIMISQAAQIAKAQGSIPGAIERMVERATHPPAPWREILRRFIAQSAAADYSWSHPSRRHIAAGMYLPGIEKEGIGEIAITIDTSGSIDMVALSQFGEEVRKIAEDLEPERVHVFYVDCRLHGHEVFERGEEITFTPKGGGGTDFRPAFEYMDRENIDPKCLIYFTDLYCNRYPAEPDFPVLWAVFNPWGGEGNSVYRAPFGETVGLSE